ncbi:MAG: hypothetical protein KIT84_20465 [Labilithrix sp.]|nr:hypothetical protein [Labilithrix sp.]MCW5813414.1 hypothetical protein [Labilithrix sp.]
MSDALSLTPQQIAALRSRQIAFLTERLTDERARGDWRRSFEAGYDHLLTLPLEAVLDPKALVAALEEVLTQAAVRGHLAPIVREVHRRTLANLRTDDAKLGDYVPEAARESIDELVARPDLVPEEVIRRVFDDEVVEVIMRDVIYDSLVEFNESVNPFFAEWGLPALIKKVMPIGSGAVLKSMSAVRGEFDKRLEPEMRKYLLVAARKSKGKIADFVVGKSGDPKMVALRRNVARFLYDETVAALTKNVDDDARMELDAAIEAIVEGALQNERVKERLLAELEALVAEHGETTIGAFLERIGVVERPALDALADLTWPFVKLALESPPARAFWERVTWDFYATLTPEAKP